MKTPYLSVKYLFILNTLSSKADSLATGRVSVSRSDIAGVFRFRSERRRLHFTETASPVSVLCIVVYMSTNAWN